MRPVPVKHSIFSVCLDYCDIVIEWPSKLDHWSHINYVLPILQHLYISSSQPSIRTENHTIKVYINLKHQALNMAKALLFSSMILLFLSKTHTAQTNQYSSQLSSRDHISRTVGPTCVRSQILRIAKCACYLGTHGVTLSDMVHQACREAFGDDYASPSSKLYKSCKIFEKKAGSSGVHAEMKVVHKAASKCISSMTSKTSYRLASMPTRTARKGLLRHKAARVPWIPIIIVAFLLTGDTPR